MQRDWVLSGEPGTVKINAIRGGTINEISSFLTDFEIAYAALLDFDVTLKRYGKLLRFLDEFGPMPARYWLREGFEFGPFSFGGSLIGELKSTESLLRSVPATYQLELTRVSINSPGFWEFLGALNPLQQLLKFLELRHEWAKEKEFRETEKEKRRLENELIMEQVIRQRIENLRELHHLYKEIGGSIEELEQFALTSLGSRLSALGKHQDIKLIE